MLDENEAVIYIKGSMNLKSDLRDQLELEQRAIFFMCQLDEMFTKRESELLQRYMQEHGKQQLINEEFEDLF